MPDDKPRRARSTKCGGVILAGVICAAVVFPTTSRAQGAAPDIKRLPICSAPKTNKTCKLIIDRDNPINPATIQMYDGEHVVVIVKDAFYTERYFLDYSSGQATIAPDVVSILAQTLIAPLARTQVTNSTSTDLLLDEGEPRDFRAEQ